MLLTVPEVAAILRVDDSTVRRHIRSGDLSASKPCGRLRIAQADLDAYLEATRVQPQPQPVRLAPVPSSAVRSPNVSQRSSVRDRLRADRQAAA